MDAWETLLDKTTLTPPGFDAWEHLNAQGGGTGVGVVLFDGLVIEMDDRCVDVELDMTSSDVEVGPVGLDVEIETTEYEIEVCD